MRSGCFRQSPELRPRAASARSDLSSLLSAVRRAARPSAERLKPLAASDRTLSFLSFRPATRSLMSASEFAPRAEATARKTDSRIRNFIKVPGEGFEECDQCERKMQHA